MADKTSIDEGTRTSPKISPAALETSRLLLEFLHAAYATRNLDRGPGESGDADGPANGNARPHGTTDDVSAHAVRVAIHVHQHGERTVGQVASGLGISYGWASRVVEEAESSGYLIRERDPDDRRVVRVRLNPEREEEVERATQWRGQEVQAALEPLTEAEAEAVRLFLCRVTELILGGEPEQS